MATASLTGIDQYLATTYRPDCDYVDGELQERSVGKFDHSNLQRALILYLGPFERVWNLRVLPEQRIRVSATRVRIPDVCLISRDQPSEQVLTAPPLVCIEILSEGDTLRNTQPRLEDFRHLGVEHLWVFDPEKREAYVHESGAFRPVAETLSAAGTAIAIHLPSLFDLL